MPSSTGKYKLFASTGADDGKPRPCAFFASPAGCKNGSTCKFSHEKPSANVVPEDSSSVVSSESEDDSSNNNNNNNNNNSYAGASSSPNVVPKQESDQYPESNNGSAQKKNKRGKNKRKQQDDTEDNSTNIFAKPQQRNNSKNESNSNNSSTPQSNKRQKVDQNQKTKQQTLKQRGMPNLDLPIASFETPKDPETPKTPSFPNLDLPIASFETPKDEKDQKPPAPLPTHSATGRKWLQALKATRDHPKYANRYDFTKYRKTYSNDAEWITIDKPYGDWCKDYPQAIAMDCEMCATKCPKTGKINSSALCRVSIVNAERMDQVLLDTLVKPEWPVVDYRTAINGIEEKHLKDVKFTLQHAQKFLLALCSAETIMMGHALQNDLVALRMQHYCSVDSAHLFSLKDEPGATIALRDLTMGCLNEPMPNIHDSVNDARMALRCLETYVDKKGKVDPMPRHYPPKNRNDYHKNNRNRNSSSSSSTVRNENAASQLFMHRIPAACESSSIIADMFVEHTHVRPVEVEDIDFKKPPYGSTKVTFASPKHMQLAFDTLADAATPDKSGRLQKKVYLADKKGYVHVRKMVHERDDPSYTKNGAGNNQRKN